MSMTRGPLPPGIYWRRRVFVLGVVAAVVLLGVVLIGGGGGSQEPDVTASRSGAETSPSPTPSMAPADGSTAAPILPGVSPTKGGKPAAPPLATPVGRCDDSDIAIAPSAEEAIAGQPVALTLSLQTVEADACTWQLSARHLALTITRDGEEIWTSRECPGLIPEESVIVRSAVPNELVLDWSGRRSERGCAQSDWVEPGVLQIDAAAYGGEPGESEFDLATPTPDVIETPAPAPKAEDKTKSDQGGKQNGQQQDRQPRNGQNQAGTAQEGTPQDGTAQDGTAQD